MRTLLLGLLLLSCACETPAPSGDPAADLQSPGQPDQGALGDGGGMALPCVGKAECDCFADWTSCQPQNELCWCPHPACGPGACICGGGRFLGCAPRTSDCENPITCRPAGRIHGPDAKGCLGCGYATDCQTAYQQMLEGLKALRNPCDKGGALLAGLSCAKNPECVTRCVNDVARCEDIGCGLCLACGCGTVGPFERCFFACTK